MNSSIKINLAIIFLLASTAILSAGMDVDQQNCTILPVRTISSLLEINENSLRANGLTIVTFDLDGVIFKYKEFVPHLPDDSLKAFLGKLKQKQPAITEEEINAFFVWLRTDRRFYETYLLESIIPELIENLYRKNIVIIGLTARKNIIANLTNFSLMAEGINLAKTSGIPDWHGAIKNTGKGSVYLEKGVIYTGNMIHKAEILPLVADIILSSRSIEYPHQKNVVLPVTMYHIDDSEAEIKAFSAEYIKPYKLTYPLTIQPIHNQCYALYANHHCQQPKFVENTIKTLEELFDSFKSRND